MDGATQSHNWYEPAGGSAKETALFQNNNQKEEEIMKVAGNTLRKRKNNVWELRITYEGERIGFYGKTQAIVVQKYKAWKAEFKPEKTKKPTVTTVGQWLDEWLEIYKKPSCSKDTFKSIQYITNKHIRGNIGSKNIRRITNADLQRLLNNIEGGNTRHKIRCYIKSLFKTARINNVIKIDPAEQLNVVVYDKIHSIALTKAEQEILFKTKAVSENLKKYYIFVLLTGQRRSEALRFNPKECTENFFKVNGTKTKKSQRMLPFFDSVKRLLGDKELKFDYKPDYVTRQFHKIFENRTVRDLRKTFATNCHEYGISQKVVQSWMGHTTIAMTMDIYTDVREDFALRESEKFDQQIAEQFNNNTLDKK
ncbi:MAG: tyrosine-type recombinase/integrase [Bacillota bacterium]